MPEAVFRGMLALMTELPVDETVPIETGLRNWPAALDNCRVKILPALKVVPVGATATWKDCPAQRAVSVTVVPILATEGSMIRKLAFDTSKNTF